MVPNVTFKKRLEDFIVEEIDAYPTTGNGSHTFVRIRKTNLNTEDALSRICERLNLDSRECGYAGRKDKFAITTQRISLPNIAPDKVLALAGSWPDLEILDAQLHTNKLKPGHLKANRFKIVLRDVSSESASLIQHELEHFAAEGFPNLFGHQRFGQDDSNALKALEFLRGTKRPPRNQRVKRFLFSALQARWFNQVLEARVANQTFAIPQHGDLLKKHTSGGMFLCEDEQTDRARAQAHEVSPTGPMFGAKMTKPSGAIWELEHKVLTQDGVDEQTLEAYKPLGEGTRRSLRAFLSDVYIENKPTEKELLIQFELPKGCYATTVLSLVANLTNNASEGDENVTHENEELL